ncbi:hypothetical protein OQA88_9803 [Cercophora sp. LCS_1]
MTGNQYHGDNGDGVHDPDPATPDLEKTHLLPRNTVPRVRRYGSSARDEPAHLEYQPTEHDLEVASDMVAQDLPPPSPSPRTSNGTSDDARSVSWADLPQKKQLIVITLARLSEPLVQTSLQSYMFYMLKWFSPELPDSVISSQAGILHASFTAAQFITAMMWGRLADSSRFGRKTVLMIGLGGTSWLNKDIPLGPGAPAHYFDAYRSALQSGVCLLDHILAGFGLQVHRGHH